jgi:hypothetical protein
MRNVVALDVDAGALFAKGELTELAARDRARGDPSSSSKGRTRLRSMKEGNGSGGRGRDAEGGELPREEAGKTCLARFKRAGRASVTPRSSVSASVREVTSRAKAGARAGIAPQSPCARVERVSSSTGMRREEATTGGDEELAPRTVPRALSCQRQRRSHGVVHRHEKLLATAKVQREVLETLWSAGGRWGWTSV